MLGIDDEGDAGLRLRGRHPGVADVLLETWRPERRGDPAGRSARGAERPSDAVEGEGVALDLDSHDALPDALVADTSQRVTSHELAAHVEVDQPLEPHLVGVVAPVEIGAPVEDAALHSAD